MKKMNLSLTVAVMLIAISYSIAATVTVDVEKTHQRIACCFPSPRVPGCPCTG